MKKIYKSLLAFIIMFFVFTIQVNAAGELPASLTGNNSVERGSNIDVCVRIGSVPNGENEGRIFMFGGKLTYDSQYLELKSWAAKYGWNSQDYVAGTQMFYFGTFSVSNPDAALKDTTVGCFTFKALQNGTTQVSVSEASGTNSSTDVDAVMSGAKSISIVDPAPVLSSNTKLSALSVEGFSISPTFNANTKDYTLTVPADTTSVKVNATAQDSNATLSGDANKTVTLTGDSTTVTVKVTAQNGTSTANYKIVIKKQEKLHQNQ